MYRTRTASADAPTITARAHSRGTRSRSTAARARAAPPIARARAGLRWPIVASSSWRSARAATSNRSSGVVADAPPTLREDHVLHARGASKLREATFAGLCMSILSPVVAADRAHAPDFTSGCGGRRIRARNPRGDRRVRRPVQPVRARRVAHRGDARRPVRRRVAVHHPVRAAERVRGAIQRGRIRCCTSGCASTGTGYHHRLGPRRALDVAAVVRALGHWRRERLGLSEAPLSACNDDRTVPLPHATPLLYGVSTAVVRHPPTGRHRCTSAASGWTRCPRRRMNAPAATGYTLALARRRPRWWTRQHICARGADRGGRGRLQHYAARVRLRVCG